jgi:hypothetical protein
MPRAQQPTLDGTLPQPTPDYATWVDTVWPTFTTVAATGRRFTTYEIAHEYELPEPPNPRADWGNLAQLLARHRVIEHCGFDRSSRPTGEKSAVAVWRGTPAAQQGRAA